MSPFFWLKLIWLNSNPNDKGVTTRQAFGAIKEWIKWKLGK